MEDPAIYDSSHLVVTCDDGYQFVSSLVIGDVFQENGALWHVTAVDRHGDDVHLQLSQDPQAGVFTCERCGLPVGGDDFDEDSGLCSACTANNATRVVL